MEASHRSKTSVFEIKKNHNNHFISEALLNFFSTFLIGDSFTLVDC